ncbi:MAG: DUF59 domain-containing protein [Prolixibacteraceae bacterium]|nr:DUF59 domain-containing protein [Prolixibacteraceae bacterium]
MKTITERVIEEIKNVFDPEIPVNIYDLGLIYNVSVDDDNSVKILMTLTSPGCPIADQLVDEVRDNIMSLPEIKYVDVQITFEPAWDRTMMSEEARFDLGL